MGISRGDHLFRPDSLDLVVTSVVEGEGKNAKIKTEAVIKERSGEKMREHGKRDGKKREEGQRRR